MRRWLEALRLTVMAVAVTVSGFSATARAQVRPTSDAIATVAEVERILQDGAQLEQQRRWGEALAHYEEALRKHPGQREFTDRLSTARAHYEVGRRYSDQTFLTSIRQISEREALD